MQIRELNENWKMRCVNDEAWQEAVVPGTVYTDLLRNENMEDPYWKDNEDSICALMNEDYEYECVFEEESTESCSSVFLKFEGLDTVASVYLNGELLGEPINMHRVWEYEVQSLLKEGENTLRVVFHSPLKYIAEAFKKYGNIGNDDTYEGFMHLRKAHYMFGWDWGAHLPDAGIFRPVKLCKVFHGRIDSVYVKQTHEEGKCTLDFDAEYFMDDAGAYDVQVKVTAPNGEAFETALSKEGKGTIVVENPELWWVNGLGGQPLYEVEAVLSDNGEAVDTWTRRIGLRSMTMQRVKDEWGESFAHEINGKAFFAMGADYIPEEHLLGRRTKGKNKTVIRGL